MVLFQAVWLAGEPLGALRTPTAQAGAYTIGMMWSFFWNRSWVFRSSEQASHVGGDALRFFAVQILCLLISVGLVTAMIDGLGWPALPGWLAAMVPLVLVNYYLVNQWVFPHRNPDPQARAKTLDQQG